uniref:Uncharacterized protein n=1 Tax=Rhizophora mucronata TaxID=61149 RepID=A0A2P2IID1_RHIMU
MQFLKRSYFLLFLVHKKIPFWTNQYFLINRFKENKPRYY